MFACLGHKATLMTMRAQEGLDICVFLPPSDVNTYMHKREFSSAKCQRDKIPLRVYEFLTFSSLASRAMYPVDIGYLVDICNKISRLSNTISMPSHLHLTHFL